MAIDLPKLTVKRKLIGLLTERFRVGEREPIAGIAGRLSHSFFSRPAESFTGAASVRSRLTLRLPPEISLTCETTVVQ